LPRKKRIWYPGATFHVMSRGNRRGSIFKDRSDYIEFIEQIYAVRKLYPFKVHALCLMTNHFNMLIETGDIALSKIMHKLLLLYAANYNIKYKLTGHLFENRYVAQIIEDERYFLEVSRYIHLNPVKAQMVREPLTYEYSSYTAYMNMEEKGNKSESSGMSMAQSMIADLTDTSRVLGAFRHNSIAV